jgi:hypothetical protein
MEGVAGSVSGSRVGDLGGVLLLEAETDGLVVPVEEAADDGFRSSSLGGGKNMSTL